MTKKNLGWSMFRTSFTIAIFLLFPLVFLNAQIEFFRTVVEDIIEITPDNQSGSSVNIGINSSVIINLDRLDARFLRGIELEITAPQNWLQYRGSLAMTMYNNLSPQTGIGIADLSGSRFAYETLPSRLRNIYHIPIRVQHGLRTTTTVSVFSDVVQPSAFPVMFRMMQLIKGLPDEFEQMTFNLTVRPILSDEGAVRLIPRYPPQLWNRPFIVLINDNVITNISEQIVLREGEHHLVILSDDYRNESRRFFVERGRVIDLYLDLHDPSPIIIFEGPQNTQVFLNNVPISGFFEPITVEPGIHEVSYQIGNYIVIRTLNIQRGKTYRVALAIDLTITEED